MALMRLTHSVVILSTHPLSTMLKQPRYEETTSPHCLGSRTELSTMDASMALTKSTMAPSALPALGGLSGARASSTTLRTSPTSVLPTSPTLRISLLRRTSCLSARSHTPRASGSDTESAAFSRAGNNSGKKGAASIGFSTSLDMFSMITAVVRLMAVCFSRRPRTRRGTMTARAGESMVCTNTTPPSLCMSSGTSWGLMMQSTRSPKTGAMSLLPATLRPSAMAFLAAFFTSFLISVMHGVSSGMMAGRQLLRASGLSDLHWLSMERASTRVRQSRSCCIPAKRWGTRSEREGARSFIKAAPATVACSRTASVLAAASSRTRGAAWMM
mmetsp:Transcript_70157/g.158667  ORF Transcript_70157/g.158667 Transcript_70157/m.158667 type:complete len:329 (-) Transcript_70157:331-1317(-)